MSAIQVDVSGDHEKVGRQVGIDRYPVLHTNADWTVDVMEKGMQSGRSSVMLIIPVDVPFEDADGKPAGSDRCLVVAETSVQLWINVASIMAGKCRDEVDRPGYVRLSQGAQDLLRPRFAEAIRRCITTCSAEEAETAAGMLIDAMAAGDGL